MGGLWAARLWQLAQKTPAHWDATPVHLLLRDGNSLQRWQQAGGLRLRDKDTDLCLPVPAAVAGNDQEAIALLLVCTKAQDTLAALEGVRKRLQPGARIVLLQNGVRVQDEVWQRYPDQQVYCLSTSHGAYMCAPFHVVHAGHGEAWIGTLADAPADHSLLSLLPGAEMNLHWDAAIRRRLWDKFAVNCAINALTVIHDCRNGELLANPQAHTELLALCDEIQSLLQSLPQAPEPGDVYSRVHAVLLATANNLSSTLQDFRAGRATEMPYLNANLRDLAHQAALACPRNDDVLRRFNARVQARG
ncbi:MAG: 2-dehydropantoate 2-reductase [Pseudomonadales bacterium]|nr:2-dehydropantoate 2-reductase [Pseudomonadales bacterium]